jgi:hypothetical protein
MTSLNFRFMLMSSTVQSIPCDSNNMLQARQGRHLNHDQTVRQIVQCKRICNRVCSAKNKEKRMKFKCRECNIGFCATPCFEVYHTKLHF